MPMKTQQEQNEYMRKWVAARRAKWFSDKFCVVCGTTERLELDHIDPLQKTHHAIWSWSWKRIEEEVAKCQVLCHQHHLEKTNLNKDYPLGVNRPFAKLTENDVRLIRIRFATETVSKKQLARDFKVSDNTIGDILNGNNWNHVI